MAMLPVQDQVAEWIIGHVPVNSRVAIHLPMGYSDPILDNTRYTLEDINTIACDNLPDYLVVLERQVKGLVSYVDLRGQVATRIGNEPRLGGLIPAQWGTGDWHYIFGNYIILTDLQCINSNS